MKAKEKPVVLFVERHYGNNLEAITALEEAGYLPLVAVGLQDGYNLWFQYSDHIEMILVDADPSKEEAKKIDLRPNLPVFFLSNEPFGHCLAKPFEPKQLVDLATRYV